MPILKLTILENRKKAMNVPFTKTLETRNFERNLTSILQKRKINYKSTPLLGTAAKLLNEISVNQIQ
jgi:hypothetical protein